MRFRSTGTVSLPTAAVDAQRRVERRSGVARSGVARSGVASHRSPSVVIGRAVITGGVTDLDPQGRHEPLIDVRGRRCRDIHIPTEYTETTYRSCCSSSQSTRLFADCSTALTESGDRRETRVPSVVPAGPPVSRYGRWFRMNTGPARRHSTSPCTGSKLHRDQSRAGNSAHNSADVRRSPSAGAARVGKSSTRPPRPSVTATAIPMVARRDRQVCGRTSSQIRPSRPPSRSGARSVRPTMPSPVRAP